jgi:ABC-type multidrug transport system fused ATPase/permease subunit
MKSFKRVLPYVVAQWPRLGVIVVTALINSILLSATIATIIPLLKVMMGQEGLHGYAERTIASERYGLSFYIPDKQDLATDPNMNYYLRIVSVKSDGAAAKAGLRPSDLLTGFSDVNTPMLAAAMLSEFTTQDSKIAVSVFRPPHQKLLAGLDMTPKPFYTPYVLKALSFVPRTSTATNKEHAIFFLMVVLTLVTAIRSLCRFAQDYIGDKVVQTTVANIRELTFKHTLAMPIGFFAKEGSSDTISRLIQDTGSIGGGLKTIITKAIRESLTAAATLGVAMYINPKVSLAFLCAAPLVLIAVSNFGRKIKRATKKALKNWGSILCKLEETIIALKVVKIYNQQNYEYSRFVTLNRKQLKHQLRVAKTDAATDPMMEFLGMIALSIGIIFGAHYALAANDPTPFFGVLILLGSSANAIRRTSDVWNRFQQSNAAAERVFAVVDQPIEKENAEAIELSPLKQKIEFENIVFTYPGTDRTVLKGVNLTAFAGQTVAVVGPNGSGKTTLVNLIPRFYEPDSGRILIDGNDISLATFKSLREQMAMVTQNVITFNDTIAANIAYGRPDATIEEITEAAKRAYAHEFVAPLPDGYNTMIGEQGAGLSGGQLQRIIIARAILKNPPIMIFDEAMSQIDADSEAKIHRALDEFMKNRTAFVIAHRFSTVIKAHKIVVMNDGQVVAEGIHSELVKTCPLYQTLYQTQLLKDTD